MSVNKELLNSVRKLVSPGSLWFQTKEDILQENSNLDTKTSVLLGYICAVLNMVKRREMGHLFICLFLS